MKENFVKDLRPGDTITAFFALRKAELMEKDGNYRLSMELGDRTGRAQAILWEDARETAALLVPGSIVKIRGVVTTYRDNIQITIKRIRTATEDEYDLADFFRRSAKSEDELSALLTAMIERLENRYLRELMDNVFGDADIRIKYLRAPAGKLFHHDYVGGLADHSLSMAEVAIRLADHYPKLDRDLLIVGTLLHDIGKIWEYDATNVIDFTDHGRLVGHINIGDEFICSMADAIEHFPDDLLMHVRHLIISHQGEPEKGSPVKPQTPEAVFLHHLDDLDSRMGALDKIRERTGGSGWSQFNRIFDRFLYFGEGAGEAEGE